MESIRYSDIGIDFSKIGEWITSKAEGRNGLNIVGVSKGAMEALFAWCLLDEPPHIDNLMIVSSPHDLDDVVHKREVELITNADLDGDALEKLIYQLALSLNIELRGSPKGEEMDRRTFLTRIVDAGKRAVRETVTGVSPKLFLSGLMLIRHLDTSHVIEILRAKGAIDNKTNVYYAYSGSVPDTVVHAHSAAQKYEHDVRKAKASFKKVPYPHGGHADIHFAAGALRDPFWSDQQKRWLGEDASGGVVLPI